MADEREEFTFTSGSFGNLNTEDLIEAGENFLNATSEEITPIKKEEKPEEKKEEKKDKEKKAEVKEVVAPKKEVKEDDVYSLLEGKINETEEENEDEEDASSKKEGQQSKSTVGDQQTEEEDDENIFTTLTKELVSNGVFSPEEDEEGNPIDPEISSAEEFLERFQVESRRAAADVIDKFLDRFGEDYKDMFESVFVKGVPPSEYLSRFSKIEGIKSLDLKDEGNQERVVRELYKSEGRSPEYIEKRITQLKNYSDLADEATEAQRILVQKEEQQIERAAQAKQDELVAKQRMRSEYITNVNRILQEKLKAKEFDGIPVSDKFAQEIFGYVTQERYQTPDKQYLTEFDKDILDLNRPENHALKIKVAMLLNMAKNDPHLTKIMKKAVSKETNTLFQGLEKKAIKTKSNTKKEEAQESTPTSWFQ